MADSVLCMNCFRIKGEYELCPYCGHMEGEPAKEVFQLKPGTILQERYIIGETIGYGGFGITYKAYDTTLDTIRAVKEYYPAGLVSRAEGETRVGIFSGSRAQEYSKLKERFIEEARNLALFAKEKDIVNVFSFFEENGTAYIIMEYIDSPLLKNYLKQYGKLQEKQACEYICALLSALSKIHEKGIIHKDISPDNIFLTGNNQIKLVDFGAAKLQNGNTDKNLSVVVKAGYAPIEQYRSKGTQDLRMDIYAAGAVLYHMITGEKPMEALDRWNGKDMVRLPSKMGIEIRPHVEKAMMKALAVNPEDRFASAEEFRDALMKENTRRRGWKLW